MCLCKFTGNKKDADWARLPSQRRPFYSNLQYQSTSFAKFPNKYGGFLLLPHNIRRLDCIGHHCGAESCCRNSHQFFHFSSFLGLSPTNSISALAIPRLQLTSIVSTSRQMKPTMSFDNLSKDNGILPDISFSCQRGIFADLHRRTCPNAFHPIKSGVK